MTDRCTTTCFHSASTEVLQYLHDRLGFGLWMVTRTEGHDWIVLCAEDHGYAVKSGDVFQWADSFCSRMVVGQGPRIAPRSADIPAYVAAPIGEQVSIGAYIGIPLRKSDGDLFGTLCAIDPCPQPEQLVEELPQIEIMARLLETILESEFKANQESRRAERAEAQAMSDSLTGLFNRRGWDTLLAAEEARCCKFAHPATVLSIDLDGLKIKNDTEGHQCGDQLLQATAQTLLESMRSTDIVSRVGGDEFLVLAIECHQQGADVVADRLSKALANQDISASIGYGVREPKGSLHGASLAADEAMYESKRRRKLTTQVGNCL